MIGENIMITQQRNEVIFLDIDEALALVDRIAARTLHFDYEMTRPEKDAMAYLLSDIGVKVKDIIDVNLLADEYAINAEIVGPDEVDDYSRTALNEALFTWKYNGEKHYCISW